VGFTPQFLLSEPAFARYKTGEIIGLFRLNRRQKMRRATPRRRGFCWITTKDTMADEEITQTVATPDGAPAVEAADRVLYAALGRGLSFKVTMGSVLTLSPPLTIARAELDLAVGILQSCLAEVTW